MDAFAVLQAYDEMLSQWDEQKRMDTGDALNMLELMKDALVQVVSDPVKIVDPSIRSEMELV